MDDLVDSTASLAIVPPAEQQQALPAVDPQAVPAPAPQAAKFEPTATLEGLRKQIAHFAHERDWEKNHAPRNLVLALAGEMGELCECFQWKGDHISVDDWSPAEREHLGEELSDVAIYLIRLADRCNIDLSAAIQDKMIKNARKYPAHLVKGSSAKYTAYEHMIEDANNKDEAPSDTVEQQQQVVSDD